MTARASPRPTGCSNAAWPPAVAGHTWSRHASRRCTRSADRRRDRLAADRALYETLAAERPGPAVELARIAAIGMADGVTPPWPCWTRPRPARCPAPGAARGAAAPRRPARRGAGRVRAGAARRLDARGRLRACAPQRAPGPARPLVSRPARVSPSPARAARSSSARAGRSPPEPPRSRHGLRTPARKGSKECLNAPCGRRARGGSVDRTPHSRSVFPCPRCTSTRRHRRRRGCPPR